MYRRLERPSLAYAGAWHRRGAVPGTFALSPQPAGGADDRVRLGDPRPGLGHADGVAVERGGIECRGDLVGERVPPHRQAGDAVLDLRVDRIRALDRLRRGGDPVLTDHAERRVDLLEGGA